MVFGAAVAFSSCTPKPQSKPENCFTLKAEDFLKTIDGKATNLYFLKNENIHAAITNYGGSIVGLGTPVDSTLIFKVKKFQLKELPSISEMPNQSGKICC